MVINNFNNNNQYLISYNDNIIFQSYETIMFTYCKQDNTIYFNDDEDNYTRTTCKYLGMALDELIHKVNGMESKNKIKDLLNSNNRKKFILSLYKGVYELWLQL